MDDEFLKEYGVTLDEFRTLRDAALVLLKRDTKMASLVLFNHVSNLSGLNNKTRYVVFEILANDVLDRMESIEELADYIFNHDLE